MYFLNQEHEENFEELCFLYSPYKSINLQYRANIYIAAVPEIYKLLIKNERMLNNGPLVSLMKYSKVEDQLLPHHPALTSSSRQLLTIGMSLYNGYACNLDFTPSGGYGQVILQALAIRYRLPTEIK